MTAVMIAIDPHKGSHTAVAISAAEEPLGDLRVRGGGATLQGQAPGRGRGSGHQPHRGLRLRPVNTDTVIGDVTDVTRFPSRDHFASCNGTAPVEVSSGNRKIYRLSLRGNRRINHACTWLR